ncbi:hypothetical protein ACHAXA_009545 [Cyclostephanos tholiformis]|uniref:Uncharacterized protein n=1 Tax=Cyclostephanos tholiformis TaxID=382380 RepID=A0ABD3R5K1_9STRA
MPDELQQRDDEQMAISNSAIMSDGYDDATVDDMCNNDDEQPSDDELDWNEIMQHEPARTEVPTFLTAKNRREGANERLATSLDKNHESAVRSSDELVDVVTLLLNDRAEKLYEYEVNLKNDYIYNEKTRASMQAKLKESSRVAQGLFANLLMRVMQPEEAGSIFASALGNYGTSNHSDEQIGTNTSNDNDAAGCDGDPDWDAIMQHEPAKSDVPVFLATRLRHEAADARFEAAIEKFHASVNESVLELTQAVADIHNSRTIKLEEYEQILKHDYASNDKMRAEMQSQLEASATAAHTMFEDLMTRVMQPQLKHQSQAFGIFTQAVELNDSP